MKKFRIAALLMCFVAFSFAMTSCQKAEDLIIGKWKCVKAVTNGETYTDGQNVGFTYEFMADNTVTMGMEGYSVPGTYTIEDDILTITVMSVPNKLHIDKISKSKMTLSDPDKPENIAEFEKL